MVYNKNFVVAIKHKNSILREIDSSVYLPFNSDYSILLKNLSSQTAVANVTIDGEDVLGGHAVVVKPNSDFELKRFLLKSDMNKGPRFKFIEKTNEIEKHRGNRVDDGIVRVEYRFQRQMEHSTHTITYIPWIYYPYQGYPYDPYACTGTINTNYDNYQSDNVTTCNYSNVTTASTPSTPTMNNDGITVKGEEVNQSFHREFVSNLEDDSHVICIRLKGGTGPKNVVQKPLTVKAKIQCSVCGKSNKSFNKFCGRCGNNLNW